MITLTQLLAAQPQRVRTKPRPAWRPHPDEYWWAALRRYRATILRD